MRHAGEIYGTQVAIISYFKRVNRAAVLRPVYLFAQRYFRCLFFGNCVLFPALAPRSGISDGCARHCNEMFSCFQRKSWPIEDKRHAKRSLPFSFRSSSVFRQVFPLSCVLLTGLQLCKFKEIHIIFQNLYKQQWRIIKKY